MNEKEIKSAIRKTKRKSMFFTIPFIVAFFLVLTLHTGLKYLVAVAITFIAIIITVKIQSVSYILFDECNPQKYYAVEQGLLKQVPIDKQAIVSEFIGDYSSALAIYDNLISKSKNEYAKINYLSDSIRCLFLSNDYERCLQKIDEFNSMCKNKRINALVIKKTDFFSSFIKGDYQSSEILLDEIETLAKMQKNSFRCNMLYYRALLDCKKEDYQSAVIKFSTIADSFPNMYLSSVAKEYLAGNEISFTPSSEQSVASELPESASITKTSKKDIFKIFFGLFLVIACIVVFLVLISNESTAKTQTDAIEKSADYKIAEIYEQIKMDGEYEICVFSTYDQRIGVACIKEEKGKYICVVSNCDYYIHFDGDYEHSSKIHAKGVTSEFEYKWFRNQDDIPDDCEIIKIDYDKERVYMGYKISSPKRHWSNMYYLDTND